MKRIAIIGGTGWDFHALKSTFPHSEPETVTTQWGDACILRGWQDGHEIIFMHRHVAPGHKTHLPPHRINYRANIAALQKLEVQSILASSAVGSLRSEWTVGSFALLDQIIDFTRDRESTFYSDEAIHTDMTAPYNARGKELLRRAAQKQNIALHEDAVYVCTNGPRFETPAEIRMFASWGADVVGMTGMPEVALAAELKISYSSIAVITNAAAGISPTPLTQQEVQDEMQRALPALTALILDAAKMA